MEKQWIPRPVPSGEKVQLLQSALHISEALAVLLAQRNVSDFDTAKAFFRPDKTMLHDPFLMQDMDAAVNRIRKAIEKEEKILIYGDYDVDGTTSVSLFYSFLKTYYPNLEHYIPDRYKEGYGISVQGIAYAVEHGFGLVVSLDCGVKSVELIGQAKEKGVDFIICDHHQPGELLPPAVAVLDPKRKDCPYPYKELSGCGVGFKLCQALCARM